MNNRTVEQLNSELRSVARVLRTSLFVIQLFCCSMAQGQTTKIDSLKAVIEAADHDTSICNAYLILGEEIYLNNPDTALIIWQMANDLAQGNLDNDSPPTLEKRYLSFLANALNNIGYIYKNQGDIPLALEYYHKSLKIKEDIGNKKGIATSLNNIGYIYKSQGDIPFAMEYYHKSLKIEEELGNKSGIAISLNNIGYIY